MIHNNQSGFSVVEALLIVLILAVVGFGGYYVWHTQKKTTNNYTTNLATTTKGTTAESTNPYTGWKTYTSSYQQASFKYPANWQLSSQANPYAATMDAQGSNNVTLTSPSGSTLTYADAAFGNQPGCSQPGTFELAKVQELSSSDTPAVYFVEYNNDIALAGASFWNNVPAGSSTFKGCAFDPEVEGNASGGVPISFFSGDSFSNGPQPLSNKGDLATAELILKSFRY